MARPLRIEFSGALYHVTSRGNGSADIYLDDDDRILFNEELSEICEQFNWFLYVGQGYVLNVTLHNSKIIKIDVYAYEADTKFGMFDIKSVLKQTMSFHAN